MILTKQVKHYGKLIKIEELPPQSEHKVDVKCPLCENIRVVRYKQITNNGHFYCMACVRQEKREYLPIGERFNFLTIIEHSEKSGYSIALCDCGNQVECYNYAVKSGHKKSCGCLRVDNLRQNSYRGVGENHPNWKGGISRDRERHMATVEYKEWRQGVYQRDNFTCQICFGKSNKLNAHHLNNYANFPEQRTLLENGVTLCEDCHKDFHSIYGNNCTREHFLEFRDIEQIKGGTR